MKLRVLFGATFVAMTMASSVYSAEMGPIEFGIDRPGSDASSIVLPRSDPNLCLAQCGSVPSCSAWSLRLADRRCFLKNSVPAPTLNADVTSGVKVRP